MILDPGQSKFASSVYGRRTLIWMEIDPLPTQALIESYPATYVVVVERSETLLMARHGADSRDYVARVRDRCHLETVHDRSYPGNRRLQIWRVRSCFS